ncbi:MAG: hypothetical protein AAF909_09345 [Pseudomonadota bacterium]
MSTSITAPPPAAAPWRPGRIGVRPSRIQDPALLAPHLRPADRRELDAAGSTPLEALIDGLRLSREPYTAVAADGRLIAMFGVAPLSAETALRVGAPWMLGSPLIEGAARPFLRASRVWRDRICAEFDLLTNIADARNIVHHRWLRWCGFTFLRRTPVGPTGRPFLEFARLGDARSVGFAPRPHTLPTAKGAFPCATQL